MEYFDDKELADRPVAIYAIGWPLTEDDPVVVPGLPDGAYHIYDYQFFYRNLQENVKVRLQQYLEK